MRGAAHGAKFLRAALASAALALACVAMAQAPAKPEGLEPVPEVDTSSLPPGIGEEKPLVTIRRQEGTEFKEYRVNGQLRAVKVTPKVGPVYWLIQRDGQMIRHDGPGQHLTVPTWLVLEW